MSIIINIVIINIKVLDEYTLVGALSMFFVSK